MAARHDGGVGHASRIWENDERQDGADEGEAGGDAEGRGVSLVEGAVDGACAESDHQLKEKQHVRHGVSKFSTMAELGDKSTGKNERKK